MEIEIHPQPDGIKRSIKFSTWALLFGMPFFNRQILTWSYNNRLHTTEELYDQYLYYVGIQNN